MVWKSSFLTLGSTSTCAEAVIANASSSSASQAVFFLMMFPLSPLAGPEARLATCHPPCGRRIAPPCHPIPADLRIQQSRPADDLRRTTHAPISRTPGATHCGHVSHHLAQRITPPPPRQPQLPPPAGIAEDRHRRGGNR